MRCRSGCGACCIAASINTAYAGHPHGKPAGMRCVHLDAELRCLLIDSPARPAACAAFQPEPAVCGDNREQALVLLARWEQATA